MSVKPGVRLGDRYQLLSPIATGGMGQVWRAEDTTLHRIVAAKILRSEFTGDDTFIARFRAEARNTAALSHPNIASIYDYGETVHDSERLAYLIMELVEGEPLVETLIRERRLSPERTLDILEQTAMGLGAAHRTGLVHRDVKPGNLIIRPDGVLKITDFGIARTANSVALTDQGTVVGTAQYLAPEQAEGKPAIPASDVYALGVVGYECLAGARPFDGDNSVAIALSQIRDTPRPLPPDVPPQVRGLIQMAMAKNPAMRYRDGSTYAAAVRQVRRGGAPTPPVAPMGGNSAGFPAMYPQSGALHQPLGPGGASSTRPVVPLQPPLGAQTIGRQGIPTVVPPPRGSQTLGGSGAAVVPTPARNKNRSRIAIILGIGLVVLITLIVAIVLALNSNSNDGLSGGTPVPGGKSPSSEPGADGPTDAAAGKSSDGPIEEHSGSAQGTASGGQQNADDGASYAIKPADIQGKSPELVTEILEAIGVNVVIEYDGEGQPPGTVSSAEPIDNISPCDTVTVHVVPPTSAGPTSGYAGSYPQSVVAIHQLACLTPPSAEGLKIPS